MVALMMTRVYIICIYTYMYYININVRLFNDAKESQPGRNISESPEQQ